MTLQILYELGDVLGLGFKAEQLGFSEMAARSMYAYVLLVAIARLGHSRLLARITAFDIILGILLGSIASRAITGNAPFYPSIAACAVLVVMHAVFAALAFHFRTFSYLVKGRATLLVKDGVPDPKAMRRTHTADHDLQEEVRLNGEREVRDVALAHLERNGRISIVEKRQA
jgi:uncharacterized membrane protein YcaP (DUF421 family)